MQNKQRLKPRSLFGLIIVLPILFGVFVNETSRTPSNDYTREVCTRFCHNSGCPHFEERKATHTFTASLEQLYFANIRWLKKNPLGLTYKEMNLLLYVLITPVLILLMLWGLIRKRKTGHA